MADVWLPDALAVKYPNAAREWGWKYVFVANRFSTDPVSGVARRHHLGESQIQKLVRGAGIQAGIAPPVPPQALRHAVATNLLASGPDLRMVPALLGRANGRTTRIHTHGVNRDDRGAIRTIGRTRGKKSACKAQ